MALRLHKPSPHRLGGSTWRRGFYASVSLIGFILSPLSWWNDAFVNIPISVALGALISRLLGLPTDISVAAVYAATNIIGMIMLLVGGSGALKGSLKLRDVTAATAASIAYTALILAIL